MEKYEATYYFKRHLSNTSRFFSASLFLLPIHVTQVLQDHNWTARSPSSELSLASALEEEVSPQTLSARRTCPRLVKKVGNRFSHTSCFPAPKILVNTANMLSSVAVASMLAALSLSASLPRSKQTWDVSNFNSLVTFGDSYTDENNLNYISMHNGTYPPTGTFLPESFSTAGGGRTWDRYVIQYTGTTVNGVWTPEMTLYDYAVSGAVCSNLITPR